MNWTELTLQHLFALTTFAFLSLPFWNFLAILFTYFTTFTHSCKQTPHKFSVLRVRVVPVSATYKHTHTHIRYKVVFVFKSGFIWRLGSQHQKYSKGEKDQLRAEFSFSSVSFLLNLSLSGSACAIFCIKFSRKIDIVFVHISRSVSFLHLLFLN